MDSIYKFLHKTSFFPLQIFQKRSSNLLFPIMKRLQTPISYSKFFLFDLRKTEGRNIYIYTHTDI